MAEQTGATESQSDAQAQAADATTEGQGAAQGATSEQGDTVESLRAQLAQLSRANYEYREERRKREEADKAKAEKDQTESERLTTRLTELERQLADRDRRAQEQSLRLASITEAQRLGFRNPDIAFRLIDSTKVEYDENGSAKNVGLLLQEVAKSDPYLLVTADFGGGQRGQSVSTQTDMNALIRRSAGR